MAPSPSRCCRAPRLLVLLLASLVHQVQALRISSIEVPAAVMNSSQQALLVCNYELQGDQLYSVKWYKNYVEFYRFQPAAALASGSDGPGGEQPQHHYQHQFDLDGIQLNLQRSNSSHVYLRQVTLASEGTYKCEVSAEAPSFATVSMERQMKVYVLPKQKLAIVDNNVAATNPDQTLGLEAPKVASGLYNVNDMINLTCVAGWSRPRARLSWQLNEQPISAASKWLSWPTTPTTQDTDSDGPTKLTLAFQLQPGHLLRQQQQDKRLQVVRLRCLALLSAEFRAETTVQLAGGKSSLRRPRQREQPHLPQPAPLQTNNNSSSSKNSSSRGPLTPLYRWPPASPATMQPTSQLRRKMPAGDQLGEAWMSESSSSLDFSTDPSVAVAPPIRAAPSSRARGYPPSSAAMYTGRQLRAQAEHIEQVVLLAAHQQQPNELEAPLVEASTRPIKAPAGDELEMVGSPPSSLDEWTSSARQDYELNDLVRFTCRPRVAALASSFTGGNDDAYLDANNNNNDGDGDGDIDGAYAASGRRVYSTWLINNKEISGERVNAFDGANFYYSPPPNDDHYDHHNRHHHHHQLASRAVGGANWARTTASEGDRQRHRIPSISHRAVVDNSDISDNATSSSSSGGLSQANRHEANILIEFTPSLIQLKEFSLKCVTRVEQPLIEYASELMVSVPASQFIQVDPHHQQQQQHKNRGRPSQAQKAKAHGNQRNRNGPNQQNAAIAGSPASSAAGNKSQLGPRLVLLASVLSLAQQLLSLTFTHRSAL